MPGVSFLHTRKPQTRVSDSEGQQGCSLTSTCGPAGQFGSWHHDPGCPGGPSLAGRINPGKLTNICMLRSGSVFVLFAKLIISIAENLDACRKKKTHRSPLSPSPEMLVLILSIFSLCISRLLVLQSVQFSRSVVSDSSQPHEL